MSNATKALPPETTSDAGRGRSFNARAFLGRFGALLFLLALVIFFTALRPNTFPTPTNLFNIARQASILGLISIGMTFVILTGGIDLSVGSLMALSGIVAAYLYKGGTLLSAGAGATTGIGVVGAILVASLVGLVGGLIQGFVITRFKIPPFIVTLGGMSAFRGLTLLVGNGGPISAFDDSFKVLGQGRLGDIPIPVLIFLAFAVIAFIVLRYTQYGRYVYAVGGNAEAARLSGLNSNLIIMSVYMIVGLLAGFAGFMLASRLNSAEAIAGTGAELNVIAAVVIGGTSLVGGEGGVFGTVIGSLLISVLSAGLTQLNVTSYIQQIIIGLVIVFAVLFDRFTKARRT
ncbi:MAG: ABC transporter permease [Anaerolineae bacterium]|nr:ABC transporter permease [Anaerolineae bacterium]